MNMLVPVALLALLAMPAAVAEPGGRRGEQMTVFEARKAGRLLPYDQIIKRISGQLPGWRYNGLVLEADPEGNTIYKLVFERDGDVTWIYVDGRTGNTLGRK